MKDTVIQLLEAAIAALQAEGVLPQDQAFKLNVDSARDKTHGDFATNIALVTAKAAGKPPRQLADLLIEKLPESSAVAKVEIAGPGFINFFMSDASSFDIVNTVRSAADGFGLNNSGAGESVQIEFVSANPTGPPARRPRPWRSHWRLPGTLAGSKRLQGDPRILL